MAEYIDRQAAIEKIRYQGIYGSGYSNAEREDDVVDMIESIPAADVRPVVRGKWTMHSDYPDRLICSECGTQFDVWHWEATQMYFCPHCGADMREGSRWNLNLARSAGEKQKCDTQTTIITDHM